MFNSMGRFLHSKKRKGNTQMPRAKFVPVDERIASKEKEIRQNHAQLKLLLQEQKDEERKKRTHRICVRGAMIESLLPDTIMLTISEHPLKR